MRIMHGTYQEYYEVQYRQPGSVFWWVINTHTEKLNAEYFINTFPDDGTELRIVRVSKDVVEPSHEKQKATSREPR